MRYLHFKGSPAKILLPSAETKLSAEDARHQLFAGTELAGVIVTGLDLASQRLSDVHLRNCILEDADLSNATIDQLRLERVVVVASTLVGLRAHSVEIRDVMVDGCRFDLAMLEGLKATGPAAILSSSLREVDLTRASAPTLTVHGCELAGADVTSAQLGDLRGNDLDGVRGLSTLRGVTLSSDQMPQVLAGLQRDLQLVVDDSDAGPAQPWSEVPER